jgi:hypothetical protein
LTLFALEEKDGDADGDEQRNAHSDSYAD